MARRRSMKDDFDWDMRDDPEMKADTSQQAADDLRVRRGEPAVIPPPEQGTTVPTNAAGGVDLDRQTAVYEPPMRRFATMVRGGVSLPAILTGVLVALGATIIFYAIAAGILAATHVIGNGTTSSNDSIVRATVLTGVGIVLAQFLAYLWGGYTAGRMARGAGAFNGFLVPLFAIVIGAGVGVLVGWLGTTTHLNYSFQTTRLPIDRDLKIHLGIAIGAASVLAMFIGGIAGGVRGVWWHRKLERAAAADEVVETMS
jgi:hypothetical protein